MKLTGSNLVSKIKETYILLVNKNSEMMATLMTWLKTRLALTPLQVLTSFPGTSLKRQLGKPTAYSIGWGTLAACTTYSS